MPSTRKYTVMGGDSPALIAAKFAGCPKCAIDLVAENKHKQVDVKPNGFVTFKSLRPGEELNLPDKWFDGTLDGLPKSYFTGLAHPDGVTGLGAAPFSAALIAAAQGAVNAMASDPDYCTSVRQVGSLVNNAVHNFKSAWNASQSQKVPINTGNYESSVAAALTQVAGHAPPGCDAPQAAAPTSIQPAHAPLSTGAVVGIGLLVAGAIGGVAWAVTHHPPTRRKVQRVHRTIRRRIRR